MNPWERPLLPRDHLPIIPTGTLDRISTGLALDLDAALVDKLCNVAFLHGTLFHSDPCHQGDTVDECFCFCGL
jgi:hypothetical protein